MQRRDPRLAADSLGAVRRSLLGAVVWIVLTIIGVPDLLHPGWAHALLGFAALVLLPLWLELARSDATEPIWSARLLRSAVRLQFAAALTLALALALPAGPIAVVLALPWFAVLIAIAIAGALRIVCRGWSMPATCGDAALVFASVGAAWVIADRAGMRPIGFQGELVLLTAVHFHYAGMILPLVAARAFERVGSPQVSAWLGGAVVAGVPAVAVGITLNQLQRGAAIELVAALLMAVAGAGVALVHIVLGLQTRGPVLVRCLWVAAGASLLTGMMLAVLYATRSVIAPWPWLDIPWMRALHGSINALGFSLPATIGWWWLARAERTRQQQLAGH